MAGRMRAGSYYDLSGAAARIPFFLCRHVQVKGGDQLQAGVKIPVHLPQIYHFDIVFAMITKVDPVLFFVIGKKILLLVRVLGITKWAPHSFGQPLMRAKAAF